MTTRASRLGEWQYQLARCEVCSYVFVQNPCTDFAAIYDRGYYTGQGADPLVDYEAEMSDERTTRVYEWRGITAMVGAMRSLAPRSRWLDYGCGLGGLVRHVAATTDCDAFGFDEGYAAERLTALGIAHLARDDLVGVEGSFDVVTAIEVLEHAIDPVELLEHARSLLVPGGLFLLTTGNAAPHREHIDRWSYAGVPDVHVGFFEPRTLADALERAGFEVLWPGRLDGLEDVLRYKILKTARLSRTNAIERALPWRSIARIVDARYQVSAMPAARRPMG